ncbi:MAG: cache domain-containing protein [bacterium]
MKFSIRKKIIFAVLGVILVFGSLAVIVVAFSAKNDFLNIHKDDLKKNVIQTSDLLDEIFAESTDLVNTIASQEQIGDYLKNPTKEKGLLISSLIHHYNIGGKYTAIYVMDKNGTTLFSTNKPFIGNNYSFRDYFKDAKNGKNGAFFAHGVTSNDFGYYFSAPVYSEQKEFLGVAVVKINPEEVNGEIDSSRLIIQSQIMFAYKNGVIVYSDNKDRMLKSLGPVSKDDMAEIVSSRQFAQSEFEPLDYNDVLENIRNYTEPVLIQINDKIDGETEYLALSRVGTYPFYVVLEKSTEELDSLALQVGMTLGLFVLLAALFAALIISFVVVKILNPISKLQSLIGEIAEGKVHQTIDIQTGDEFEELGRSFNKMSDTLQDYKNNVEEKIKERTEELEKINKNMVGRELKMIELKKKVGEMEEIIKKKG